MFQWAASVRRRRVFGFPLPDLLLAGFLCAVAVASVLTGSPDEGQLAITLPVAFVSTLAVCWRRRSPVTAVVLLLITGITQTLFADTPGSLWSLVVYAIVMYSLAAHYSEGRAAVVGIVMVTGLLFEERLANGVDYLFVVLLFGGLWLLGRASRLWRSRVSHAEQHQADLARIAVAEERLRIARDLHDIVAHSLSVIAVQAEAAEAALMMHPERAREPVLAIRGSARDSLGDIRRMLQVLRTDDDSPVPTPGLAAVQALIAAARSAGVPVEFSGSIDAARPAVVDLAAYRIVQESLTNVIRHAPGMPTSVSIRQTATGLELEIANQLPKTPPRPGHGAGLGLIGIRERVTALQGTLTIGPTGTGQYRVRARLPMFEGAP